MAWENLPHYKQKQALLFGKEPRTGELTRMGRKYLEEGWLSDAIACFERAGDTEALQDIRRRVIEEGDAFLYRAILKALDTEAKPEEWGQLGDRARLQGKLQFAREAFRMAGDRKSMDAVDKLIRPESDEPEEPEALIEGGPEDGQA